jgi:hypothetical protein
MTNYGHALKLGYNGERNLPEAMKYFKMFADLGKLWNECFWRST